MIIIITNSYNPNACNVIDWLCYYKTKFIRVNNFIEENYKINICFKSSTNNFVIKEKNNYWLNRTKIGEPDKNNNLIKNQLFFESYQSFFKNIDKNDVIGQFPELSGKSKYQNLVDAKDLGLKIPDTLITNKKSDLKLFFQNHDMIITKSAHDMTNIKIDNNLYRPYTSIIAPSDIENLNDHFGISLFQEYIDKICDIKALYFGGEFFAQAIFSQNNENTKIDFRLYNKKNMNRSIPFKLPNNIEKKTEKLLELNNFKIAVVDFILDKNNELFFLEINPDGIYDLLSYGCNYYIEKKIADYLYEKENRQ
jgi:hypothetical protein